MIRALATAMRGCECTYLKLASNFSVFNVIRRRKRKSEEG